MTAKLCWLLGLFGMCFSFVAQAQETIACGRATNANIEHCLNFFDPSQIEIESVQAISDLPVFHSPLLSVEYQIINRPSGAIGIAVPPHQMSNIVSTDQQPEYCQLIIVGASSDSGEPIEYIYVEPTAGDHGSIRLFAFCRNFNLPGVQGAGLPFPSRFSELYISGDQRFIRLPDPEKLESIILKAISETCFDDNIQALNLHSLATQFAIFTYFEQDRDTFWRSFLVERYNPVYDRSMTGIYCLLEEADIQKPEPTPTATAVLLPTATALPTLTPIVTATPTRIPLIETEFFANHPFFPNDATLGEVLGIAAVSLTALILAIGILRSRRRVIVALVGLALMLVLALWIQRTSAQEPDAVSTGVDVQPPSLLMVILLDDSATMTKMNTISTARDPDTGRLESDPKNIRSRAAIDLIRQLDADRLTSHQVAVLSFSNYITAPDWLSDDLVRVGGGETDTPALEALIRRLETPRLELTLPGDTRQAVEVLEPWLTDRLQQDEVTEGRPKPVIVLITDDVPLRTYEENSPWTTSGNWPQYIEAFETSLQKLADLPGDDGYCANDNAGITLVTMAIGAANWVNHDGTIVAGDGDFFRVLAGNLQSFNPFDNGKGWVYVIDPQLADADSKGLVEGFQNVTRNLLPHLRCQWTIDLTGQNIANRTVYTLPVSGLFKQIQIKIDVPQGDSEVSVTGPNGEDLRPYSQLTEIGWAEQFRRQIWTMQRDGSGIPAEVWQGEWTVTVTNTEEAVVYAAADLDLSDLRVDVQTETQGLIPNQDNRLAFRLLQDNFAVVDQGNLIQDVKLQIRNGEEISFNNFDEDRYDGVIPGSSILQAGSYDLSLRLILKSRPGMDLPPDLSIPVSRVEFSTGLRFDFDNLQPEVGAAWECPEGMQRIRLPFTLEDVQANPESVGSYTRVDVYYPARITSNTSSPPETPAPTSTAAAVLQWDFESAFVGDIPCQILAAGENQQAQMVVVLPNGTQQATMVAFDFSPTLTQTPTTAPSATPPTPPTPTTTTTPMPAAPNVVVNTLAIIQTPPLSWMLPLLVLGIFIVVAWRGLTNFVTALLPLSAVDVSLSIEERFVSREPLLPIWKRYIPVWNHTVTGKDNLELFQVRGEFGGRRITIKPLTSLTIDDARMNQSQTYSSKKIKIEVQRNRTYELINNRVRVP